MLGITESLAETPVYTYVIASGDMRYIENNQRNVYLRQDPDRGLIVRGEIPGCEPDYYADLSQIFLEYGLTCEGCKTPQEADRYMAGFGACLGEGLALRLRASLAGQEPVDRLSAAFEFLLRSMAASFSVERGDDQLRFVLEYCPLGASGRRHGIGRELALARRGFVALCQRMLQALAPQWSLRAPAAHDPEQELREILLTKD